MRLTRSPGKFQPQGLALGDTGILKDSFQNRELGGLIYKTSQAFVTANPNG